MVELIDTFGEDIRVMIVLLNTNPFLFAVLGSWRLESQAGEAVSAPVKVFDDVELFRLEKIHDQFQEIQTIGHLYMVLVENLVQSFELDLLDLINIDVLHSQKHLITIFLALFRPN
jgi:hypothetical protein